MEREYNLFDKFHMMRRMIMKKQVNSKKIVHIRSLLIAAILINMGILDACGSSSGTDSVKETTIQETKNGRNDYWK